MEQKMKKQQTSYDNLARFYDWRMDGYDKDVSFYVRLAKESGGPIIELGCGTGRALFPIAQAGVEAVGLELSEPMLDIARKKLGQMSDSVQKKVLLIQGNMADFVLKNRFSAAILPDNQFRELQTVEEQKSCLRCVANCLKKKGCIVVEISNPFRIIQRPLGKSFPRKSAYCEETGNTIDCFFKHTDRNLLEQWNECETSYVEHRSDGSKIIHRETHRSRFIFPREMELLLECSGFEVIDRWGGYNDEPLGNDSACFILRAKKIAL